VVDQLQTHFLLHLPLPVTLSSILTPTLIPLALWQPDSGVFLTTPFIREFRVSNYEFAIQLTSMRCILAHRHKLNNSWDF